MDISILCPAGADACGEDTAPSKPPRATTGENCDGPRLRVGGVRGSTPSSARGVVVAVIEPYGIWGGLSEFESELILERGIRRAS